MQPKIIRPFSDEVFAGLQRHVEEVRRLFDWPGIPYHDDKERNEQVYWGEGKPNPQKRQGVFRGNKFNRWHIHRPPLFHFLHQDPGFLRKVCETFDEDLKPSYCFLSMYGPEGVCPIHTDRPQCQRTVDLVVRQDSAWPIYVEEEPYKLCEGEGLCYSGTGQEHYRKPMKDEGGTYCDLVFFHYVPRNWMGAID